MNGIVRFNIGREFNVITVSIDPRDKPQDAAAAKERDSDVVEGYLN